MNPPAKSKINYTALLMAMIGLLIAFDVVPPEAEKPLTEATLILGPMVIAMFRTWFTG
jgi:hypothetical protein